MLVRDTSVGRLGIEFRHRGSAGPTVDFGVIDDMGWADMQGRWTPYANRKRLASSEWDSALGIAIADATELSVGEAIELAHLALQEWRERGGEEAKGDLAKGLALVTAIGAGVLFAIAIGVALIALIVILLARVL